MDMYIDRAKHDEAEKVYALYHALIDMQYGTWSEEYPSRELVYQDVMSGKTIVMRSEEEKIVAAIALLDDEDEPEFEEAADWYDGVKRWGIPARLGVAQDMQGKGIAKKMLAASIEEARKNGCDAVRFLVAKKNVIAQRAYAGFGFDICGECSMWGDAWLCYQMRL